MTEQEREMDRKVHAFLVAETLNFASKKLDGSGITSEQMARALETAAETLKVDERQKCPTG